MVPPSEYQSLRAASRVQPIRHAGVLVRESLAHTGRLITGAAAIMAGVFFGFGVVNSVTMIKAMGIGMGLAVIVDATIVRALLVPATMRLLGRWNWWAPAALARRRPWGA